LKLQWCVAVEEVCVVSIWSGSRRAFRGFRTFDRFRLPGNVHQRLLQAGKLRHGWFVVFSGLTVVNDFQHRAWQRQNRTMNAPRTAEPISDHPIAVEMKDCGFLSI